MILRLEQTARKKYILLNNEEELESFSVERSGFFTVEIPGLMKQSSSVFNGKQDRFKLENGEIYNQKEGFFIFGYIETRLSLGDRNFQGYEVGNGRKGHFLCIYEGMKQVAMIEKDRKVINNKDTYTLYVLEPEYIDITKIFAIHWDCASYSSSTNSNIPIYSKRIEFVFTINKFLKSKYDPTFISRCI